MAYATTGGGGGGQRRWTNGCSFAFHSAGGCVFSNVSTHRYGPIRRQFSVPGKMFPPAHAPSCTKSINTAKALCKERFIGGGGGSETTNHVPKMARRLLSRAIF